MSNENGKYMKKKRNNNTVTENKDLIQISLSHNSVIC